MKDFNHLHACWDVEHSHWKMVVGRLLSYWEGTFSGAMLNFERVTINFVGWVSLHWRKHLGGLPNLSTKSPPHLSTKTIHAKRLSLSYTNPSLVTEGRVWATEMFHHKLTGQWFLLGRTVDGSEIRRSPLEVVSFSHNVQVSVLLKHQQYHVYFLWHLCKCF